MLWLGPDEWLVVTPDRQGRAHPNRRCAARWTDRYSALTDVSHSRAILSLSGPDARSGARQGMSARLSFPRVRPGALRPVEARQVPGADPPDASDTPAFEIYVHRSFAEYAWTWLEDAGREFGVRIAPAR